ncbi:alpha/beta hydrolase [Pseudonocardia nematodicida]|uniref:Alpha/beta hydrolase n=1 Tax=Pseudonocardia nematodicida TaxID=1206997 RepID=A0ABV1KEF4_9PSEU
MALQMDAQVADALAPLAVAVTTIPPAGDWRTRRETGDALLADFARALPGQTGTEATRHTAAALDGTPIELRFYRSIETTRGPLAVYLHGGGMFSGSLDTHGAVCRRYATSSGVPVLAAAFRLAPEHPFPTAVEDSYAALCWAVEHAGELGVDPSRIAIMGDSAGAGMAAAVALMVRDRGGPVLARQILIHPMLDDRTTSADAHLEPWLVWTGVDNRTGWGCLLGDAAGGPDVPGYASPAREPDLVGLAPAYIEIGQLDLFRAETVEYVERLGRAGVEVEFHLHAGVPHLFDLWAPHSDIARRAVADRVRVLRAL